MRGRPPQRTLFPYTTLFRSAREVRRFLDKTDAVHLFQLGEHAVDRRLLQRELEVDVRSRLAGIVDIDVGEDRKSTRLNSSHGYNSYAVFCLKKKTVSGGRGA